MNKGIPCKQRVRLLVEELESRLAPAGILDYQTGAFTVGNYTSNGQVVNFQLSADKVTTSKPFQATPNGPWQVVESTPSTFSYIRTPNAGEWAAIQAPAFGDYNIVSSRFQLADNSFLVKDAEALGPDKVVAGACK